VRFFGQVILFVITLPCSLPKAFLKLYIIATMDRKIARDEHQGRTPEQLAAVKQWELIELARRGRAGERMHDA
jgi:hypothetical protein